ncbi:down syndrome cell adhesion molecule-like protein 1 [Caerostris extrusa]|uniref:Down syndrome cell adhesion molecule-like protein 1 n=1 Tax=Caerostris extrusa TaxID=172846 RepID=A0AAV4U008_CAEEX|nr:down syndrome cell adhesion molecule-like protein 1 [Caerostris extrusa]
MEVQSGCNIASHNVHSSLQVKKLRTATLKQSTYITGLQPITEYDIVVKAFNSAGAGPKSIKISGKTLETAPPTSPIVQIDATTSSTISISWKKDIKDKAAIPGMTLILN